MTPKSGEVWWLRPDFHEWFLGSGSGVCTDGRGDPLGIRADAAYSHALYRVEHCSVPFDRTDAILAMKRSFRARLEHLDATLKLRTIPVVGVTDPNDWLGRLESLGIIKKGMLRRLNRLRNAIEHDGVDPPSLGECRDYLEIMWYFLKVTTPYLRPPDSAELTPDSDELVNLDCGIKYEPFELHVHGNIAEDCLIDKQEQDWIKISITEVRDSSIARPGYLFLVAEIHENNSQAILLRCIFEKFL
jgi:hypothetical protein